VTFLCFLDAASVEEMEATATTALVAITQTRSIISFLSSVGEVDNTEPNGRHNSKDKIAENCAE
jgi:hypothetical protein